jgi:t-SNARE complex subunit (syntaxin)
LPYRALQSFSFLGQEPGSLDSGRLLHSRKKAHFHSVFLFTATIIAIIVIVVVVVVVVVVLCVC